MKKEQECPICDSKLAFKTIPQKYGDFNFKITICKCGKMHKFQLIRQIENDVVKCKLLQILPRGIFGRPIPITCPPD